MLIQPSYSRFVKKVNVHSGRERVYYIISVLYAKYYAGKERYRGLMYMPVEILTCCAKYGATIL